MKKTKKLKGKRTNNIVEEEGNSDNMDDDADLLNMDININMGGVEQEQLTAEEKEEVIIKTLTTNNP